MSTLPVPLWVSSPRGCNDREVTLKFHTQADADAFWRRMAELMEEHANRTHAEEELLERQQLLEHQRKLTHE